MPLSSSHPPPFFFSPFMSCSGTCKRFFPSDNQAIPVLVQLWNRRTGSGTAAGAQARSSLMPSDPGHDKYGRGLVETGRKMCPFSQSNSYPDKHFAGLLFEWIFNIKHATCSNKSTFIILSRRALSKIPLALLWVRNNSKKEMLDCSYSWLKDTVQQEQLWKQIYCKEVRLLKSWQCFDFFLSVFLFFF